MHAHHTFITGLSGAISANVCATLVFRQNIFTVFGPHHTNQKFIVLPMISEDFSLKPLTEEMQAKMCTFSAKMTQSFQINNTASA